MKIAFAMCGSFCTHQTSLAVLETLLAEGHHVLPVVSEIVRATDTRFGTAEALCRRLYEATGHAALSTVPETEPLGPQGEWDLLLICPCTGNTAAKMAAGITDSSVTMAAKSFFRVGRPVLLALSTNDGLGANLRSVGTLTEKKNVYFVPMRQDDPEKKPTSLSADFSLVPAAVKAAANGKQMRPLFLI